jgi:bifunctional UDP-N-acetylglucosamine pyrophosphorylase/glucosamine-1-phosphate N-acetyltransferase
MGKPRTNNRSSASTVDPMLALRAQLEQRLQECARLMAAGVNIVDPATTYVDVDVEIGEGTAIYPNTTIMGSTIIGRGCRIGPNTIIADSRIGDGCEIFASVIEGSSLETGVDIGPYCHLRPDTYLESGVHIGNFVEIKAARLGAGTRAGHFSYIGDADVGADVNIGAGTVTCNYDGTKKNKTVIGDRAFIGSDTMLVAPVSVGTDASTGAGSVVTKDVPDGALVAGVPARRTKPPAGRGKKA